MCPSANAHKRQLVRSLNARPALLPLLIQDPNPKVRAAAILEAGWSGRRGSERLIGIALLRDPDPNLREYAAGALARLGGAEAIKALNAGVADPVLEVRVLSLAALLSLGQSVDPKVRARLDEEALATGKRTSTSWLLSLQM